LKVATICVTETAREQKARRRLIPPIYKTAQNVNQAPESRLSYHKPRRPPGDKNAKLVAKKRIGIVRIFPDVREFADVGLLSRKVLVGTHNEWTTVFGKILARSAFIEKGMCR
jgi:hypothetical protein